MNTTTPTEADPITIEDSTTTSPHLISAHAGLAGCPQGVVLVWDDEHMEFI